MVYIEIECGKIKGLFSASRLPDDGRDYRVVPTWFPGVVGQDVREFDTSWNLLPLEERLRQKLIPDAERYKAVGEELVPKSPAELVRDGIAAAPRGMKLDPAAPAENPCFIDMTLEERVAAGEITRETAAVIQAVNMRAKRNALLADCDWTQANDQRVETQLLWRPYRQALRDISDQSGFPWSIEWPARPDGLKV